MLVIFDLDNTLEEFAPHERVVEDGIFTKLSAKYGIAPLRMREVFDSIKQAHVNVRSVPSDYDRREWFARLFHIFHLPEPVDTWTHIYWEQIESKVRVFPHTIETLQELAHHYTLCILSDSDGSRPIKLRRIERLGLTKLVDTIFTSDAAGHNKPHPRAFLQVLEHYHAAAEECIMVGDNPAVDLQTAHELGMHTVWLQTGASDALRAQTFAYVDAEIATIDSLPHTLQHLTASDRSSRRKHPAKPFVTTV